MNKVMRLVERIGALQRSEMRRFALDHGLQMVHLEVLSYLQHCNRYSDTTQALSDFLGQTKGSISQTVGFLESEGFLKRTQDAKDKRVFHLEPLAKGRKLVDEFESRFYGNFDVDNVTEKSLEDSLRKIQKQNGLKSFGLCAACRFNTNPGGKKFICGLTGENLSLEDSRLICREYEAAIS